jgi:phage gp36-like protein
MAYAVADDMKTYIDEATLILLCDDVGTGVYDDGVKAVINAVLADQQPRIDAAMKAAGYVVPTVAPGAGLRSLTCRLALAALYARRPVTKAPEALKSITAAAEDELTRIAQDKAFIAEGVRAQFMTAGTSISYSSDPDRNWASSELS